MKTNIILEKSTAFAIRIVNLSRYLKKKKTEAVLVSHLLRSGTSVAANVQEATVSVSTKEFYAKMCIAMKETREANFWLKVPFETKTLTSKEYQSISFECTELEKILFAILKKIRQNNNEYL